MIKIEEIREVTAQTAEVVLLLGEQSKQIGQLRLGEIERVILQETSLRFRSSRRMGAVLGLSPTAVFKKMHKYKLPLL